MTLTKVGRLIGALMTVAGLVIPFAIIWYLLTFPNANVNPLIQWASTGFLFPLVIAGPFLFRYFNSKPKLVPELRSNRRAGYVFVIIGVLLILAGTIMFSETFGGLWSCFVTKTLPNCEDAGWYTNMLQIEVSPIILGLSVVGLGLFLKYDSNRLLTRLSSVHAETGDEIRA
jgi:hypothetical protein